MLGCVKRLTFRTGLVSAFEQLKQQLGGKDPAEILRALNSQTDELKRLREELATRPLRKCASGIKPLNRKPRNQKDTGRPVGAATYH
jgi:hypothetical protein